MGLDCPWKLSCLKAKRQKHYASAGRSHCVQAMSTHLVGSVPLDKKAQSWRALGSVLQHSLNGVSVKSISQLIDFNSWGFQEGKCSGRKALFSFIQLLPSFWKELTLAINAKVYIVLFLPVFLSIRNTKHESKETVSCVIWDKSLTQQWIEFLLCQEQCTGTHWGERLPQP